jgi:hypothetical protein
VTRKDTRKGIPTPNTPNFLERMREAIMVGMGQMGNKRDRFLTVGDLDDAGIIKTSASYLNGGNVPPVGGPGPNVGTSPPDLTPPPTPTGLLLSGAISHVFVECDAQLYTVGHGHGETILYGVPVNPGDPLPTFANALELARFPGIAYAYPSNPALTWRMWIKWRSRDGAVSVDPAGGINGTEIKTGQNVQKLVEAMTGPGNPFKIVTAPITLPDGSVVPEGTYTSDAYIHNGQIVNAKIANLAVDNAKIASLAVDKLTAGSLNVGAFIQSTNYVAGVQGFRINGAGFAEFSGATVRGTIFASAGTFSGDISAASGNFRGHVTGGSFTGSAWPPAGQNGFYIGPSGLLLGNFYNGRYFQVDSDGNVYAPGFTIQGGNATFSGSLNVSSGPSGPRVQITNSQILVFDGPTLRVRIGVW